MRRLARDSCDLVLLDLLLTDIHNPKDAAPVVERIRKKLSRPFLLKGHRVRMTASIGTSLYPLDWQKAATLMTRADMAMYRVKKMSRAAA